MRPHVAVSFFLTVGLSPQLQAHRPKDPHPRRLWTDCFSGCCGLRGRHDAASVSRSEAFIPTDHALTCPGPKEGPSGFFPLLAHEFSLRLLPQEGPSYPPSQGPPISGSFLRRALHTPTPGWGPPIHQPQQLLYSVLSSRSPQLRKPQMHLMSLGTKLKENTVWPGLPFRSDSGASHELSHSRTGFTGSLCFPFPKMFPGNILWGTVHSGPHSPHYTSTKHERGAFTF